MAFTYPNGEFPRNLFIVGRSGVDADGPWEHLFPPGTYDKWIRLQERVHAKTGKWLALSTGYSVYRPLDIQFLYQSIYGLGAATPRTSSHGGKWEGRVCFALDIGNWAEVYNGDRAAFYADCRAVGLEPGLISPERGYPDEPWHVNDFESWRLGSALDTPKDKIANPGVPVVTTPTNPKKTEQQQFEEDLMTAMQSGHYYTKKTPGQKDSVVYLILNHLRGTYHEYSNGPGNGPMPSSYNNAVAVSFGTGGFTPITEGHADVLKREYQASGGNLTVDLAWDDVEAVKAQLFA